MIDPIPQKPRWWMQPEHLIPTLTLLFVAAYTILTLCIFLNTRSYNLDQLQKLEEANGIAKNGSITQTRAYLYVSHEPIVATQNSLSAAISIHHAGLTPAYKIQVDTMMEVGRYLVGETRLPDVTSGSVGGVERHTYSILYSTQEIPITVSVPLNADEAMRAVRSNDPLIGDNRIYLHGVVRYLDIFGVENLQPERRYEFCFVYHPDRDPTGGERGCEKYNNSE